MKKLILPLLVALLAGCSTVPVTPIQKVVVVDKPIPVVPPPPVVPPCDLLVKKLTAADAKTPGLVGEAYKHDMLCLITRNNQQAHILDVYTQLSKKADLSTIEINQAFTKLK
jgi:hypothetical protein